MPRLIDHDALPFVRPTSHAEVSVRASEPMQRIVADLLNMSTSEKPPSEAQRDSAMRRCPMRSLSSLAKRPIQPLWQSLPAIERFLAPLGKDGRMSRSNWHSEINRETINVGSDGDEQ